MTTQVRHTKTESRIREALAHLLRTKGLEGLTVSELSREAGINRGTFYAHYVDKYDLVQKQLDSATTELSAILLAEPEGDDDDPLDIIPHDRLLAAMRYVFEEHELLGALTNDGRDMRLQSHVKDVIGELMEKQAVRRGKTDPAFCGLPHDYGREVLLSGTVAIIWLWLRKGCLESPEEITDVIFRAKDVAPSELLE
jgi:AcrR family transcriptional regulator